MHPPRWEPEVTVGSRVWRDLDGEQHAAVVVDVDEAGLATIKYETGHHEEGVDIGELTFRESVADFPMSIFASFSQSRARDDLDALGKSQQHRIRRRVTFTCLQEVGAQSFFSLLPLAAPCSVCNKLTQYRCKRCSSAFYCSKICQQRDSQSHEGLCEALASPFRPLFSFPEPSPPQVHVVTPPRTSPSLASLASSYSHRGCVTPLSSPSRRQWGQQTTHQKQQQQQQRHARVTEDLGPAFDIALFGDDLDDPPALDS